MMGTYEPTLWCVLVTAIDCGHPGRITNGRVDVSRGTKLGAIVRYSCKRGYKLKGRSTRKCKQTGRWNSRAPTCKSMLSRKRKYTIHTLAHWRHKPSLNMLLPFTCRMKLILNVFAKYQRPRDCNTMSYYN